MPLRVTYWTQSQYNQNLPGSPISTESITISGTTAQSGVTPPNAVFVSLRNTETGDVTFIYNSANPTALAAGGADHGGIGTGERIWLDAKPAFKVAGITAL